MTDSIEQLVEKFARFPGVGQRQARRFVYFLLKKNITFTNELADAILNLKKNIKICSESYQYFYSEDPSETRSPIARNRGRDRTLLMIVEKDADLEAIEKSKVYHGLYFVLGGLMPAVATKYASLIRDKELLERVQEQATKDNLQEIIFGLSLTPESEHTRSVLEKNLSPLQKEFNFKISRLGRGLSTGTELEYSDGDTLSEAMKTRVS